MKQDLVDQFNIDGCIHLKGMKNIIVIMSKYFIYLFKSISNLLNYRFMGDSKRSVKNKAQVEGSISASYLHRETIHFCSYYFKNFMLSPRNRRNEIPRGIESFPSMLSIFNQCGRSSGKKLIHWFNHKEWNSVHVHVLINCNEVKPYLE